jgi:hypothetical protein
MTFIPLLRRYMSKRERKTGERSVKVPKARKPASHHDAGASQLQAISLRAI